MKRVLSQKTIYKYQKHQASKQRQKRQLNKSNKPASSASVKKAPKDTKIQAKGKKLLERTADMVQKEAPQVKGQKGKGSQSVNKKQLEKTRKKLLKEVKTNSKEAAEYSKKALKKERKAVEILLSAAENESGANIAEFKKDLKAYDAQLANLENLFDKVHSDVVRLSSEVSFVNKTSISSQKYTGENLDVALLLALRDFYDATLPDLKVAAEGKGDGKKTGKALLESVSEEGLKLLELTEEIMTTEDNTGKKQNKFRISYATTQAHNQLQGREQVFKETKTTLNKLKFIKPEETYIAAKIAQHYQDKAITKKTNKVLGPVAEFMGGFSEGGDIFGLFIALAVVGPLAGLNAVIDFTQDRVSDQQKVETAANKIIDSFNASTSQ